MRVERGWTGAGLAAVLALAGCSPERDARVAAEDPPAARAAQAAPADVGREMDEARAGILARGDSVRGAFDRARGLTREERSELRRDVNAAQVAAAQRLGVRASGDEQIERLRRQGRLVALEDSTAYWVLRDLDHSRPFVTPDTREMLLEVGRRFHERLDSLGLPRYRMEVTSVLRTAESQAELRSVNSNAAAGVSAHEFGTTLDVSHVRFAPPEAAALTAEVPSAPELTPHFRVVEAVVLEEVGRERAVALQGELGRVLGEMRDEGKLRVMMERRQPVYHMTVARRFPAGDGAAGR